VTTNSDTVHQLKITLRQVAPAVWRRIVVPSDTRLSALSDVLEAAMGWSGGHLHEFDVGGERYGQPDPDGDDDAADERGVRLAEVLPTVKSKLRWDYDFGDGWEHDVVVEAIAARETNVSYPVCLAGDRACPPEDCGGPMGYERVLEALADPSREDHEHMMEWAPPGFDPARFDLDGTDVAVRASRPLRGW
jgi:Plasmid pRiA4b ORF-3-like protein